MSTQWHKRYSTGSNIFGLISPDTSDISDEIKKLVCIIKIGMLINYAYLENKEVPKHLIVLLKTGIKTVSEKYRSGMFFPSHLGQNLV